MTVDEANNNKEMVNIIFGSVQKIIKDYLIDQEHKELAEMVIEDARRSIEANFDQQVEHAKKIYHIMNSIEKTI